jgi:hypothetical protein
MANTLTTIDSITNEVLRLAHEKLSFIGTINRQFDPSFGQSSGKIGDTLRIRLPAQYTVRANSRVMNVQDSVEQNTSLVVARQDGVDMKFNSREMKLDLQAFSKQHLESAVSTLVSVVESNVLQGVTKEVYNLAGTAGTPPVDLVATGAARAKLNQFLAPKDGNRCVQMDSVTMGGLVNGLKGLFQDSAQIKEQYREGMVGRTAMADFYENERTYAHTNGSDVTGVTLDTYTVTEGDTSLTVTGASGAPTEGTVFTIAGVNAIHPETKADYGYLKQFVVGAGATTTNIPFTPAIYSSVSGGRQNVSALPTTTAALVFVGSASTAYQQNLMYHKDAFTFATAALPMIGGAHKCVTKTYDGVSVRCWQDGDIVNDELLTRIDILYGWKAIRPDWACRITS